jgi:hypothetical protein
MAWIALTKGSNQKVVAVIESYFQKEDDILTFSSTDIDSPLFRIVKCSILVAMGDRICEFKADQKKVSENNIVVPTDEPHRYRVVSLPSFPWQSPPYSPITSIFTLRGCHLPCFL